MRLDELRIIHLALAGLIITLLLGCGILGSGQTVEPDDPQDETTRPAESTEPGQSEENEAGTVEVMLTPSRAALPSPSRAPSPTPQFLVRVIESSINVRTGPGRQHASIGFLYRNDIVSVHGENDDGSWYLIDFKDEKDVWIASSVVEVLRR